MKKSKIIQLVLVVATLSVCNRSKPLHEKRVFMRSDTTAGYSHVRYYGGARRYYVFRPYGLYTVYGYERTGFYSSAINKNSNIGYNSFKGTVVRGGFGSSAFHVSS